MTPLRPLEASSVELDGALGSFIRTTWKGNLRVLDWERDFLAPFREKRPAGTYVGMGKTLAGLTRISGLLRGEAADLRRRVVSELLAAQKPDGYLGLYGQEERTRKLWDVHEQSYLLQALVEDWRVWGGEQSLHGARRLAQWMLPRLRGGLWREVGEGTVWSTLAVLGLDRGMLRVAEAAGLEELRAFVAGDLGVEGWFEPIVEGRQGGVEGHVYAYIARSLAQLELRAACEDLPRATEAAMGYLTAGGGLAVSGSAGQEECWDAEQRVDGKLGETCATAYLIRWWEHLLRRTGDPRYADLLERALYNALFAALSPDGRRVRYYTAVEGPRTWHTGDTYCCPGNFRRIVGELGGMICHRFGSGIALTLYEAGRFSCEAGGASMAVAVETGYPWDGSVRILLAPSSPAHFPLALRVPRWCAAATVRVGAEAPRSCAAPGWEVLDRTWRAGDVVELRLDMSWRLVRGIRAQRGRVALMRGPVLWATGADRNPELADRLGTLSPRLSTCRLVTARDAPPSCELNATTPEGADAGPRLVSFQDPGATTTYFRGAAGEPSVPDELLAVAAPPAGVVAAPPA